MCLLQLVFVLALLGGTRAQVYELFEGLPEIKIVAHGTPESGRKELLAKMNLADAVVDTIKSGFVVERVRKDNVNILSIDITPVDEIEIEQREFAYIYARIIIFVVDSSDLWGLQEVKKELHLMRENPYLRDKPFLVFANKQERTSRLNPGEVADLLGLYEITERMWRLQPCSDELGSGIVEGMQWVAEMAKILQELSPINY